MHPFYKSGAASPGATHLQTSRQTKTAADAKDVPILIAAVREGCSWLVTFNVRHFRPGHPDVTVLPPGDFVLRVRGLLAAL